RVGARVALAAGVGAGLGVVAGVIHVLVVHEAQGRRARAFHVPHVADLSFDRRVLVAEGLALAFMAQDGAALLLETLDRIADRPDHGPFVFVINVVVPALVGRVRQLLPGAVRLL